MSAAVWAVSFVGESFELRLQVVHLPFGLVARLLGRGHRFAEPLVAVVIDLLLRGQPRDFAGDILPLADDLRHRGLRGALLLPMRGEFDLGLLHGAATLLERGGFFLEDGAGFIDQRLRGGDAGVGIDKLGIELAQLGLTREDGK